MFLSFLSIAASVPCSVCPVLYPSTFPVPYQIFLSLGKKTERISMKQGSRIREKMRIDVNRFCNDVKTGADGYHTFHPRTDDGRCVRVHNFMLIEQILLTNFIRRTTCIIHYTISFSCRHTHLRLSVRSLRFLPAMALPVGKRLRMSDKCSGGVTAGSLVAV